MSEKLIIIGAGPKAMAIASKSCVLRELGMEVPEVHIIERCAIGAHWTGKGGYTNGRLTLGTSPEKDVGFPYRSTNWGPKKNEEVNRRMQRFSWASFLIDSGQYSAWVDRGRPAPEHSQWAEYLQWVAAGIPEGMFLHHGEVEAMEMDGRTWKVGYRSADGRRSELTGDGVVVTGPGKIRVPALLPIHDRLLTVESFWKRQGFLHSEGKKRVAVIGSGENAASIAMALVELKKSDLTVEIISPSGMTFSRGESYQENRVYSDPSHMRWNLLTEVDRRNFIKRTDRGVFSLHAQRTLDQAPGLEVIAGRVVELEPHAHGGLTLRLDYAGQFEKRDYDYVVLATGADQLTFLQGILSRSSWGEVARLSGLLEFNENEIEKSIDESLGIGGLTPRLHLPMLSGIAQGPGFANLSCLGTLSDRILAPYTQVV